VTAKAAGDAGIDLANRLGRLREGHAFRTYQRVRDCVLHMQSIGRTSSGDTAAPSAYWSEELRNIEYMLDASPLIVDRLRQHSYHITGIWPYTYRSNSRSRPAHELKKQALFDAGDASLFVPEPPDLGGFGFDTPGGGYNVDTLKYFEVLIALDRAAVLQPFREPNGERRFVWEIGTGWGGFAYQFKTIAPNTTYVLVDLPELFLFSATYLLSMFPDARAWFYGVDGTSAQDVPWQDVDFVFLPNTALHACRPPRLDLTLNMVSFQEMTTEQVAEYVSLSAELGSTYLYSLNRERSLYNTELSGVSQIISKHYWPHQIEVLPLTYVSMPADAAAYSGAAKKRRVKKSAERGEDLEYKHVVGWKRVAP
jgi:hypothetical protein